MISVISLSDNVLCLCYIVFNNIKDFILQIEELNMSLEETIRRGLIKRLKKRGVIPSDVAFYSLNNISKTFLYDLILEATGLIVIRPIIGHRKKANSYGRLRGAYALIYPAADGKVYVYFHFAHGPIIWEGKPDEFPIKELKAAKGKWYHVLSKILLATENAISYTGDIDAVLNYMGVPFNSYWKEV